MIAIILLLVLGVFIWIYQRNYMFTSQTTLWEVEINEGSFVKYEIFGSNVLKITRDGASYINNKGETLWITSYEMKNPTVTVNGDYAAIADIQGNSIYICNTDGVQGLARTALPVSKAAISEIGVVAAVLEDSASSHIGFFHKNGSALDITIISSMTKSGYPFDISLSSDAAQLMASYIFIQNGELKSRVVFYNFSEIGKSIAGRLVGGFDEQFQGALVGVVQFLESPYSCAFSTSGLTFFSSKNLTSPTIVEQGNLIILHNQDSCMIYNMAGVLKLDTSFDYTVSKIRQGNSLNTLILIGPQVMKKIKLH